MFKYCFDPEFFNSTKFARNWLEVTTLKDFKLVRMLSTTLFEKGAISGLFLNLSQADEVKKG